MKLNIVPARTGMVWAKTGIKTFFRQPLAMAGLFFMFMAVLAVVSRIPLLGLALAMALLPAATLGLMAASREADAGKFPMPTMLLVAFRSGGAKARAILLLGALYAGGFLLVLGVASLVDGGSFAKMYLGGASPSAERMMSADFQGAMWTFAVLHLPLSFMFWHAPALVHWDGVPPVKSLFFSVMACFRNFWAYAIFGLVWLAVLFGVVVTVTLVAGVLGSPDVAANALFPALMLMAAMFFTSLYFTYRDTFETPPPGDTP